MRQIQHDLKDPIRDRYRFPMDRNDFATAMHQAGAPEGFSMEWIFDCFEVQPYQNEGRS